MSIKVTYSVCRLALFWWGWRSLPGHHNCSVKIPKHYFILLRIKRKRRWWGLHFNTINSLRDIDLSKLSTSRKISLWSLILGSNAHVLTPDKNVLSIVITCREQSAVFSLSFITLSFEARRWGRGKGLDTGEGGEIRKPGEGLTLAGVGQECGGTDGFQSNFHE